MKIREEFYELKKNLMTMQAQELDTLLQAMTPIIDEVEANKMTKPIVRVYNIQRPQE